MKKIFNFTKKKKGFSPNTSDTASVLSLGYDLKEKDLVKVHKAAYGGDLAKLKQLAKKNDINQLDKDNRTALHVACVNGHTDVVQFLVESKAKLNLCDNQNRSPLMKAVQCQQERCVATLLEHDADPNLVDVNGNTALHLASCIPSITTAMLLLENDATINAQNKEGYSPLTMAVKENHADMTEFLLKEGADINIKDLGNRTPLMIAACNGQISLVRLLLQYDADITSKDNNGWSSDDYAVMNGHHACSHLIIEHGAKRKSMRSPAHAPTRKSQASMLASSSQEAGFSLGGPATDKEEQGAIRAGQDVEDNSQTESMSRASKSVADDSWPSSDEDDELHIALKKHPKPNLKKLMNISKKQNDAVPVTDLDESEHESEDRVQRNQPCPQAFLPRCAPQHVVSPISAASFTFKPPQMTSSPFQSSIKEKYSTEDDEEYEEKDEGGDENEQEKSYIEELVDGNMKHQTEENNNPLVDALIPGSENASTEKQRDFLSELGLEKEDEEDSWDTESGSGSPRKQNARAPPKGPVCIISEKNEVLRHDDADRDDVLETEVKGMSGKQLTSSILSKLEMSIEDTEKKTDALDWDRLSTTSKRNLPGCRPPPSIDSELKGEATFPPISAVILADVQAPESSDPDIIALADSSRPEEISSPHSPLPLASQHFLVSQTWPHAQKMLPQCGECEEDSDWDSDHVTTSTSSPVRLKKQLPNITKSTAMLKPHNLLCGPSPFKQEGETSPEPKKQPQEEKDFVLGPAELYVSNSYHPGPVWSDACQKTDGEGGGKENKKEPGWEKHYENIWVEVEKRDVKSIYKNVAGELKEMFGEVSAEFLHETTGEEIKQNVEATTRNTEAESSDKEEVGELIVHPLARAGCIRNTVILTISEQKEVGVKDPLPESADISHFEDRFQPGDTPGSSHLAPMDNDNEMRNQEIHFVKESENGLLPQLSGGFNGERGKFDMEDISKTLKDDNVTSVKFKSSSLEFESSWSEGITHRSQNKRTTTRTQTDTGEARQGPVQNVDDGKDNSIAEEPKMLPPQFLTPPASSAQIPAPSLHSDEKLEEDVQRFKHEVGMLKILFLDLENEKALLQKEVGESQIKMEVLQKSRASWDAEGTRSNQSEHKLDVEEEEKPYTTSENPKESCRSEATETQSRLRAGDSINQRQWSKNLKRHPSKELQKDKPQNSGGVEMMEDFDDLTQSSDTATSDLEDPTSIYRQASFLMKQHDFSSLDSVSMVKLQNMFQEYERTIQREKSRQGRLVDKMRQLEAERAELRGSLEEVRDIKQALDHRQLELDTDLNNLKFQLKQEQEKHRNASMLYDKTRETLRKKEEELRLEVEGKHEVELAKRNQELKMRAILNKMKQLEEDRSETKKLLNQERSARALSETILNNHLRKQQDIVEENRKAICKSNEALSQLTEATDRERELLQQNSVLQADVSSLRAELEHFHSHSSQKESRLSEESEALRERLEDARRDLKLNEEALAQTVYQYTSQLTNLKAELVVKSSRLEHEHQTREQLEVEGESARTRLSSALQEAERCQAALAEAERALQREREEHQRSQDRLIGESANNRLAIDGLSQKLSKAESCANSFENEVHRITMTLTETEHVVTALQRDKELAGGRVRELEAALLAEREQAGRACARQEALQERLAGAQSEAMLLRQQLEEAHNKGTAKEKAVTDAQERFGDLLAKLRSDGEEHVQLVEERSKELAIKAADLRDQVYKLEEEKNERETSFRQLQQELADSLKMLSMSEASLEVNTRYRNDLEEEKARLLKERDRLKGKVEEREEEYVQAQRNINALKSNLAEKDRVVVAASQKLQEVSSALAGSDTIKKQLEEAVQRLEIENARLEAAAKQQTNKIEALQKQIQDAAIVRNRLEDLVTGLQGSKMTLEEQLGREVQKQGMLSHNAQDSHILWEEELKSRSMLGLRLAELEKEKAELSSQMDLEKKKAKKIAGQKKSVDSRLDEEIKRNTDLQKEMYRLRTLVKTAKKKLREQEGAVTEFGSPMRGEMGDRLTEAAISRMKDKVNDLTMQLEKETLRCSQLETLNCDLKEQLSSLKFLSRSNERLERSKRQLEEEVLGLRQKVEAGLMDQSQADQYRRDAEDRARQEINRKLEEVNTFLQTQAASQEVLEQMTAANEASLRLNLEQRIRELEVELNRVRSTQHESMNLRDSDHNELGRYRELYVEEMHRRKSLAAKLERCNERLVEANSKLLNERHRSKSLIASSIVNGTLGGPSLLEMGSLGSVGAYGTTLGPINRSMGGPLLNSLGDMGQSTSVEAYLAKQQNELERTISKAVDYATAELEGSTRVSPIGSASISPTSLGIAVTLEKDPVSRTAQQYLEVLKKNYKI